MADYIDKVNVGGANYKMQASVVTGTCDSPQGNSFKDFVFSDGVPTVVPHMLIAIKFTYGNTYGDGDETWPVANINSQYGNIPIANSRGHHVGDGCWGDGDTVLFYFDGEMLLVVNMINMPTFSLSGSTLTINL